MPAGAKDFDDLFNNASLKYREGKYKEALKLFQKANLLKNNSDLESIWNIAQIYNLLGQLDDTITACDRLAAISNGDRKYEVKALNLKGVALFSAAKKVPNKPDNQKFLQAEEVFHRLLKISPGTKIARYNLGMALICMHRTNEGIAELQTYINEADDEITASKARRIIKNPQLAFEKLSPDFTILMMDRSTATLDSLKGKIIMLNFVNSLARACSSQFLQKVTAKHEGQNFILINIGSSASILDSTQQLCMGPNWKQSMDFNNKLKTAFSLEKNDYYSPYDFSTFILIDHEGVIRYSATGSTAKLGKEVENMLNKALLESKDSQDQSANVSVNPLPPPTSLGDAYYIKIDAPQAPLVSIPKSAPEGNKADIVRIPKPNLKATSVPIRNGPKGVKAYTLEVRNWASYSDELFMTFSNLASCKDNTVLSGYSSRLEITAWNSQGQKLHTNCSMANAIQLQKITIIVPEEKSGSKQVYILIKDRLTGNSVQSDPTKLP